MTKKTTNLIVVISILLVVIIGIVVAVVMTNNSKEYTYETEDFTYVKHGNSITLGKFKNGNNVKTIKVPDTFEGFPVTAIGKDAFKGNTVIEDVELGANVVNIEANAFEGAEQLLRVKMPSVKTIGDEAFKDATMLNNINMPASLESIGSRAFMNTKALYDFKYEFDEKYVVKSNLKSVGEDAFKASKLSTVIIPSSMTTIGKGAFRDMTISNLFFYEGVKTIEEEAFYDAFSYNAHLYTVDSEKTLNGNDSTYVDNLQYLSNRSKWPTSLVTIGDRAFARDLEGNSRILLERAEFGENLASIGDHAFSGVSVDYLRFDKCPNVKFGPFAFSNITSYVDVVLPANLEIIPEGLFFKSVLKGNDLTIPASVVDIGLGAFSGGGTVYRLVFPVGSPASLKYDYVVSSNFRGLLSKDGKTLYSVMMRSSDNTYNIPITVETIEKYAFTNASKGYTGDKLPTITLSSHVKNIKAGAFSDSFVTNFYLTYDNLDGVTIDKDAFANIDTKNEYLLRVKKDSPVYDALLDLFNGVSNVTINTYIAKD